MSIHFPTNQGNCLLPLRKREQEKKKKKLLPFSFSLLYLHSSSDVLSKPKVC